MSKRIRVLCAIGSLDAGGSERQLIHILSHLDRQQFEPLLYLTYERGPLLDELPDDVEIFSFWRDRAFPRMNYPGRLYRGQVADLARVMTQHRVDVVYDRTFAMTLFAGPASARASLPRISCIASDPQVDVPQSAGRFLWIKRRKLAQAYRTAFRVVTVSEGVRRSAIDYYQLPPGNVATIANGVDCERVDLLSSEFTPDWERNRLHIVACGRLHESKGYPSLIDAVAGLGKSGRQVTLHILGEGPERGMLERQIAQLQDDEKTHGAVKVLLHGYVANPLPYLKAADLFCLSSVYEGMPNALLEAIACRTPVIATDCDFGPREILEQGRYGTLVSPPGNLAQALTEVVDNLAEAQGKTDAARAALESKYSTEANIDQLQTLVRAAAHQ